MLQYMSYKGTAPFDEQQDPEKLYPFSSNPFSSCLAIATCLPKHRLWYPHEQLYIAPDLWNPYINLYP